MSSLPTTWFITGAARGIGAHTVQAALAAGHNVVATARNHQNITTTHERLLALDLDVTVEAQAQAAVQAAVARFGRIDVLVNNAGYGQLGLFEENTSADAQRQFDTNVFGLFALTRAVLPIMRAQRSGNIVNFTSVAGLVGFPGSGYYAASKHAVEGWSDSLLAEVAPLGIGVTCVEPGPFRTDWAGRSLRQTPSAIPEYADTAQARMEGTKSYSGSQEGDPVRAGEAIIAAVQQETPPRHLVLGRFGYDAVTSKLSERLAAIEAAREVSLSADFPDK